MTKLRSILILALKVAVALSTLVSSLAWAQSAADKNLVFVPITPCRIIDTRNAGGMISAGDVRSFFITNTSSYVAQGGSNTNCNGAGADGSYTAAMINFTVVSPQADGYITVYPQGAYRPLTSALNFYENEVIGNSSTFQLSPSQSGVELNVYASATTHLVGDLVGYFKALVPKAPTLSCVNTDKIFSIVQPGQVGYARASSCPTGYMSTGQYCLTSGGQDMSLIYGADDFCYAKNNGTTAASVGVSLRCCTVY